MATTAGGAADAPGQEKRWTREVLLEELAKHGNAQAIANAYGLSGGTIRNAMKREGLSSGTSGRGGQETTGVSRAPDGTAVATLPPGVDLSDLDALLRGRGLDPAEWIVERVTVNEWESPVGHGTRDIITLHQLKAHLIHTTATVHPARDVERRIQPDPAPMGPSESELIVVMGDDQAPYHDPDLQEAICRWLGEMEPDRGVFTGDTMDLPTISRHQDRRNWSASAQECVDAGYRVLAERVDASPVTRWSKLRGNHDWRLESELMGRAERMAYLAPALKPGEHREDHLYSVRRLLHLRELNIELAGVEGEDWRYGEVVLAPGIVVRHEPPNVLKSARLNRTVLAGHTHRQGIRQWTTYDEADNPVVRQVVEVGCTARTREGLGYAEHPDWQAGFATVTLHPDGAHQVELAEWRNGVLTWRGERWRP